MRIRTRNPRFRYQSGPKLGDEDVLGLLQHELQLRRSLQTLKGGLGTGIGATSEMFAALAVAEESVAVVRSALTGAMSWDPLKTTPSTESAVTARKVFETPELAEMSLMQLGVVDLLYATQVNHAFAASVASSPNIQMKMGIRQTPDTYFTTNFDPVRRTRGDGCLPGLNCLIISDRFSHDQDRDESDPTINVAADFSVSRSSDHYSLPHIGSVGRSMLLCQPAVKRLDVEISCCGNTDGRSRASAKLPAAQEIPALVSDTGLTVGDLWDVVARLRDEHKCCPYAPRYDHDDFGNVRTQVTFRGTVQVRRDDPIVRVDRTS
ncbi:hypothetical protein LTR85_008314 [Meristemomyces frigidus]|nr:hypothetical protein LTR85_008314 [Meristemomyces frigidus]